jgi:hypothetical protein
MKSVFQMAAGKLGREEQMNGTSWGSLERVTVR